MVFYFPVKELLDQKIDPNEANDDGLTVLHQVNVMIQNA